MVVGYLVGPFVTGRPVDREDLARLLQKSFPDIPFNELTATVHTHVSRSGMTAACPYAIVGSDDRYNNPSPYAIHEASPHYRG